MENWSVAIEHFEEASGTRAFRTDPGATELLVGVLGSERSDKGPGTADRGRQPRRRYRGFRRPGGFSKTHSRLCP